MTVSRLLKSWATPPASWPDRFHLLGLAELLLQELSLGDVAGNGRDAGNRAAGVADRRDRQRDVDRQAVLADALRLELANGIALVEPEQDRLLLRQAIRGQQNGEGPAGHLLGRVAEHPLVPAFQLVMIPVGVLPMMASSLDSTISASRRMVCSACFCSVMSRLMARVVATPPSATNSGMRRVS